MRGARPPTPRITPARTAFAGIFVVTALGLLAVGATLPVLPRYVDGPLDGSDFDVGVVTGAFAITGLACRPLAGRLADQRGRKLVVIGGAISTAIAGLLYFVPAGIGGLIVARLFLGAGEGAVYTAGSAWVVDMTPPERRGSDHRALRARDLGRAGARAADRRADPAGDELRDGLGVRGRGAARRRGARAADPGELRSRARPRRRTGG